MSSTKRHTVHLCEQCGVRRWHFHGWLERDPSDWRNNLSIRFCSQGHPNIFKIGVIDSILRDIYEPVMREWLNTPNPLSSIIRLERR